MNITVSEHKVNRNKKLKVLLRESDQRVIEFLLRKLKKISNGKRKILNIIISFLRQYPKVVISQEFISVQTGLKREYVNVCLKELHNLGFIEKINRGYRVCDKTPRGIYKSQTCQYKLGSKLKILLKLINTRSLTPLEHFKKLGSLIYAMYRYILKNLTHIRLLFYWRRKRKVITKFKKRDYEEVAGDSLEIFNSTKKRKEGDGFATSILPETVSTPEMEDYGSYDLIKWIKHLNWKNHEKFAQKSIRNKSRADIIRTKKMLAERHLIRYAPMERGSFLF